MTLVEDNATIIVPGIPTPVLGQIWKFETGVLFAFVGDKFLALDGKGATWEIKKSHVGWGFVIQQPNQNDIEFINKYNS